jgi:hypothetical protein
MFPPFLTAKMVTVTDLPRRQNDAGTTISFFSVAEGPDGLARPLVGTSPLEDKGTKYHAGDAENPPFDLANCMRLGCPSVPRAPSGYAVADMENASRATRPRKTSSR